MISPELQAKLTALGVNLERCGDVARLIVHVFQSSLVSDIEELAILRIVEQALRFGAEPGFLEKTDELVELLEQGDGEVRARATVERN